MDSRTRPQSCWICKSGSWEPLCGLSGQKRACEGRGQQQVTERNPIVASPARRARRPGFPQQLVFKSRFYLSIHLSVYLSIYLSIYFLFFLRFLSRVGSMQNSMRKHAARPVGICLAMWGFHALKIFFVKWTWPEQSSPCKLKQC